MSNDDGHRPQSNDVLPVIHYSAVQGVCVCVYLGKGHNELVTMCTFDDTVDQSSPHTLGIGDDVRGYSYTTKTLTGGAV